MQKRDNEWRIAHRTMKYDWLNDQGRSVDWSNGLLGMPFLKGTPSGRQWAITASRSSDSTDVLRALERSEHK